MDWNAIWYMIGQQTIHWFGHGLLVSTAVFEVFEADLVGLTTGMQQLATTATGFNQFPGVFRSENDRNDQQNDQPWGIALVLPETENCWHGEVATSKLRENGTCLLTDE
jgi:hypothetical protein